MTRKEWMKEHYPNRVSAKFQGGVQFCPGEYSLLVIIDPVLKEFRNLSACMRADNNCYLCWNEEIPNTEKEKEMNQTTNTGIIGGNPLPCSSCELRLKRQFLDSAKNTLHLLGTLLSPLRWSAITIRLSTRLR